MVFDPETGFVYMILGQANADLVTNSVIRLNVTTATFEYVDYTMPLSISLDIK